MKRFLTYFGIFLLVIILGLLLWWYLGKKGVVPELNLGNPFQVVNDDTPIIPGGHRPHGGGGADTATSTDNDGNVDVLKLPLMEKIWDKPTAGSIFIPTVETITRTTYNASGTPEKRNETSTTTSLLFVDRATGNLYLYSFAKRSVRRLTSNTIPGIYDAEFLANGQYVFMRYLRKSDDTIISFLAKVPSPSLGTILPLENIRTLPANITSYAVSGDAKELAYLVKTKDGSTLSTFNVLSGVSRTVGNYQLSEWNISYNVNTPYLTQKATAYEKSYIFSTDETNKGGERTGLRTLFNPKNSGMYFGSMLSSEGVKTFFGNVETGTIHVNKAATLAEKCSWSSAGSYVICAVPHEMPPTIFGLPDDWYQGRVSFSDDLTLIGATNFGESNLISLSDEGKEKIDGVYLRLSPDISLLSFINKRDGSLWILRIGRLLL